MKFLDDVIPFTTDLIAFGSVHFLAVEDGVVWIQDASLGFSKPQKHQQIQQIFHDGSMGTCYFLPTNLPKQRQLFM